MSHTSVDASKHGRSLEHRRGELRHRYARTERDREHVEHHHRDAARSFPQVHGQGLEHDHAHGH